MQAIDGSAAGGVLRRIQRDVTQQACAIWRLRLQVAALCRRLALQAHTMASVDTLVQLLPWDKSIPASFLTYHVCQDKHVQVATHAQQRPEGQALKIFDSI